MAHARTSAAPAAVPRRLDAQNPWPGLASFGEDDREFFRGRDAEADELARLVRRERLTVLFGRSGLGKTSLLGAGLFPRLRQDLHLPVLLRIGYDTDTTPRSQVWAALLAACEQWAVEAAAPRADESLWAYFHRAGAGFWNPRNRPVVVVLVFDQFEELFTVGQVDERSRRAASAFIEDLAGLIEDRPSDALRRAIDADPTLADGIDFGRRGCKVLLSFREDFLAEMEGLREHLPSVMRNRYRLQPMSASQARSVIASGAALVDDEVAQRILGLAWCNRAEAPTAEEAQRLEIDPALLSVICSELNLRRQAVGAAHIAADLVVGAEREILVDFYERALRGIDARVRVFIEDELITAAGFRDSRALDDALHLPGVSREAIDHLVAARLLRIDDRFGVRRLELTHDVLTRVVKDSRDARQARELEQAAAQRARAIAAAQRRNRHVSALIAVAAVAAAALLAWSYRLFNEASEATARAEIATDAARHLSRESEQLRDTVQEMDTQARQAQAAASATQQRAIAAELSASEAQAQAVAAQKRALAAQRDALATNLVVHARAARPQEFDRALLLAAEAIRQFPERQDIQIEQFGRLLTAPRIRLRLPLAPAGLRAASADGSHVALATVDGAVQLLSASTWRPLQRVAVRQDGPVQAIALDRSGERLLTAADGQLVVWQLRTGAAIARQPARTEAIRRVALSADGRWAAVAGTGSGVQLWALADPAAAMQVLPASAERLRLDGVRCLGFTPDDSRLILVGNTVVSTWNLADGALATPLRGEGILGHSADCSRVVQVLGTPREALGFELRDAASGASLGRVDRPQRDLTSTRFELSGDGRTLIQRGEYRVSSWRFEPPARPVQLAPVRLPAGDLKLASVSADGSRLALAAGDGGQAVQVMDLDDEQGEFRELVSWFMPHRVAGFVFAPDGGSLLVLPEPARRDQRNAAFPVAWELSGGSRLQLGDHAYRADEIEFNRAGTVLGTTAKSGDAAAGDVAHFWSTADGRFLREIADFSIAEFSPDGSRLAILFKRATKTVEVLPLAAGGEPLTSISMPTGMGVAKLAISRDNQKLVMVRDDGSVWLHPAVSGGGARRLSAAASKASAVAFGPDSRLLAWGGTDGKVRLVSIDRNAPPRVLPEAHQGAVTKLAFNSDGRYLASGGADGSAIVHVPGEARTVARFDGHRDSVTALVFVEGNGGLALVAGQAKGERKVWDVTRRLWLADLGGGESDIRSVELGPDPQHKRRRAAVLHRDGSVSLHDWDRDSLLAEACKLADRNLDCVEWEQFFPGQPYHATCLDAPAPNCRASGRAGLRPVPSRARAGSTLPSTQRRGDRRAKRPLVAGHRVDAVAARAPCSSSTACRATARQARRDPHACRGPCAGRSHKTRAWSIGAVGTMRPSSRV